MHQPPLPWEFHPAYEQHRTELLHWLDEDEGVRQIRLVVPHRAFATHAKSSIDLPVLDLPTSLRTLTRQSKGALVHESGHRYWWWTASDDLGRLVAGRWHLAT
jgi:hypothetical protein